MSTVGLVDQLESEEKASQRRIIRATRPWEVAAQIPGRICCGTCGNNCVSLKMTARLEIMVWVVGTAMGIVGAIAQVTISC